jgi:hypothetical protein
MSAAVLTTAQHRLLAYLHVQATHFGQTLTWAEIRTRLKTTQHTISAVEECQFVTENGGTVTLTEAGSQALKEADYRARAVAARTREALTRPEAEALAPALSPLAPDRDNWLRGLDVLIRQRLIDRGFVTETGRGAWEVTLEGRTQMHHHLMGPIFTTRDTPASPEAMALLKKIPTEGCASTRATKTMESELLTRGWIRMVGVGSGMPVMLYITAAGLLAVGDRSLTGPYLVQVAAADCDAFRARQNLQGHLLPPNDPERIVQDWRELLLFQRSCPKSVDFEAFVAAVKQMAEVRRVKRLEVQRHAQLMAAYQDQMQEAFDAAHRLFQRPGQR